MSKSRIPRGTPPCGGIRLGVLPHGRAPSKNLHSWALSLQDAEISQQMAHQLVSVESGWAYAHNCVNTQSHGNAQNTVQPDKHATADAGALLSPGSDIGGPAQGSKSERRTLWWYGKDV